MNLSNKQRAVDNTSLISAHETRLTSVEATKQDVLTELSDVRVGGLTSGSILNAGILHQSGAATFLASENRNTRNAKMRKLFKKRMKMMS